MKVVQNEGNLLDFSVLQWNACKGQKRRGL